MPPLLGGGLVAFAAYLFSRGKVNKLAEGNFTGSEYIQKINTFIPKEEGAKNRAYKDQAGKDTIGIGHLIRLPQEAKYLSTTLTPLQIQDLFFLDVASIETELKKLIKVPLNSNQAAAVTSFVFNIGIPKFKTSTMLKLINEGKLKQASLELPRWKYITLNGKKIVSQGLLARRLREQALFNSL